MPNHSLNDTHLGSLSVFLQSNKAGNRIDDAHAVFYLNQVLVAPSDTDFLIGVTSAEIPYSWYNIDVENNTLSLQTNTSGFVEGFDIVLEPKNYDSVSILRAIQADLTRQDANINVAFDDATNKFTFTHFDNILNGVSPTTTTDKQVRVVETTMGVELGLDPSQLPTPFAHSIESHNVLNLSGTSSIYIHINNVNLSNLDSRGDLNSVLSKLNVTASPANYLYYQQTENQYYQITDRTIGLFEISLTDDNGRLLRMNGLNWSLGLTLHYSKKRTPTLQSSTVLDTDTTEPVKQPVEQPTVPQ
jgi:hypothetical protein